jgi:transposase
LQLINVPANREASPAVRQTFEIPLDIPDVTIETVTTNRKGHIEITVKSTVEGTSCHQCGKMISKSYGEDREIRLRHLPILGRQTYIVLRPKRYQCPYCENNPTTTQQLSWYTPRSSFTHAYEKQILLMLINSTVQDISIKEEVGYEAIMGIIDRHIERKIHWEDVSQLEVIGLDEISLKKGHRDFVAIVTGRIASETLILGVLPDRKKATVHAFLRSIPKRLRRTVHTVCADMYEGFVNAAKEVFGKRVKIVIDRFHVAKLYRSKLDNLRKHELTRLQKELSEEDYSQLKGAMWALRKSEEKLTDEDKDVLMCLFEHAPDLERAYKLCGELTSIFDSQISKRAGKRQLRQWIEKVRASELRCFHSFLKTLETWFDDISNYFISRHTSGFVEGFNNKLKVIKRRCYGMVSVTHLFQRIQLDLYGYALFTPKIIGL